MKTKMKTMRASVFQAAVLVVVLAFALYGCTTGSSTTTSTPTANSTSSSSSTGGGGTQTPTASSTPVASWPTTQQALPLNTCAQCQCPYLLNDSNYTSQIVF